MKRNLGVNIIFLKSVNKIIGEISTINNYSEIGLNSTN